MDQKVRDGWKYGPVKDPDKKEHPCCVPFAELPVEQQAKDFIFRAVIHALK
ncbi:MAG: RyR domain-containing protein [Pseudomonadota bacterium]